MEHIFTVDDLEYLYRSGRLNRAVSIIGSLLNIKPILHIKDGELKILENIRGSKRIFSKLIDHAKKRGKDFANQTMGIDHADNRTAAEKIATLVSGRLGRSEEPT